jgi:pilus assembly protein CpaB
VLENVLVLAIAQEASRDDTKPKVVSAVTLELSLADAEKLDLARSVGTLSLVLRNQLDKTKLATTGISKQELFKFKETAPVVVEAPAPKPVQTVALRRPAPTPTQVADHHAVSQPFCVEVIRNGTRAMNCF